MADMNVTFTDDEYTQLAEYVRIAQQSLLETANALNNVHPSSAMVERLRLEAENAADLRERIEAR